MPKLLRVIKKSRWLHMDADPLPQTALRDMRVENGRISVWVLPDGDEYPSSLRRLTVALALNKGHCQKFEFALVDTDVVDELGLTLLDDAVGTTGDPRVDDTHRDIVDPGDKLWDLTMRFTPQLAVLQSEVSTMIADAVRSGVLNENALPGAILRKLKDGRYL